jgi:hypothetical protein
MFDISIKDKFFLRVMCALYTGLGMMKLEWRNIEKLCRTKSHSFSRTNFYCFIVSFPHIQFLFGIYLALDKKKIITINLLAFFISNVSNQNIKLSFTTYV